MPTEERGDISELLADVQAIASRFDAWANYAEQGEWQPRYIEPFTDTFTAFPDIPGPWHTYPDREYPYYFPLQESLAF